MSVPLSLVVTVCSPKEGGAGTHLGMVIWEGVAWRGGRQGVGFITTATQEEEYLSGKKGGGSSGGGTAQGLLVPSKRGVRGEASQPEGNQKRGLVGVELSRAQERKTRNPESGNKGCSEKEQAQLWLYAERKPQVVLSGVSKRVLGCRFPEWHQVQYLSKELVVSMLRFLAGYITRKQGVNSKVIKKKG